MDTADEISCIKQVTKPDIDLFSIIISNNELSELNIPMPEDGEILDLVYVQNSQKKSSARLHLASYAHIR